MFVLLSAVHLILRICTQNESLMWKVPQGGGCVFCTVDLKHFQLCHKQPAYTLILFFRSHTVILYNADIFVHLLSVEFHQIKS